MAVSLLSHVVSDLCLGKPALRSLAVSATVADALLALGNSDDNFISVWDCDHAPPSLAEQKNKKCCRCVGKVCMVDVICYLCKEENLLSPSAALQAPVSVLLPRNPSLVRHVEPSLSLLEAIDLILQGAQNLVVPINTKFRSNSRRKQNSLTIHNGREFCWITQEDIIRFLLNSIGLFSPIASLSLEALGIITTSFPSIHYYSPAASAVGVISCSLADQTSVAVVDEDGILIGEISPVNLSCCDLNVAAAIATLSAGDLMAYVDCGGQPEDLVNVVEERLKERNLLGILEEFGNCSEIDSSFSTSSEEDFSSSPTTPLPKKGKHSGSLSHSARMARRAEAIVCHPKSSLVAVMIQAIAHRVNYAWVVEDNCSLVGIVTFRDMLKIFWENLEDME